MSQKQMIRFFTPDDVTLRNFCSLELPDQPGAWSVINEEPATEQRGSRLIQMEEEQRSRWISRTNTLLDPFQQHSSKILSVEKTKHQLRPTPGKLRLL